MKRVISALIILVMCAAMVCPVFAAEFVPSITYKETPDIVPVTDGEGKPAIGVIKDADGNVIGHIYEDCLVITPISQVDKSTEIPADSKDILQQVYGDLVSGKQELPYEQLGEGLNKDNTVIRDLIDISWLCQEHEEIVSAEGTTVTLTFDLGVGKDTDVYVMTYIDGQWNKIVSVVNNGDGTITCVFEDFCPVAFIVPTGADKPPVQTGDPTDITLWVVLMAVSAVALVAVVVLSRRKVSN